MKTKLLMSLMVLLYHTLAFSQNNTELKSYLKDSLSTIQKRVETKIIPSRYMVGKLLTVTDSLKDWENVSVTLYEYKVTGTSKKAKVYLANANAKKLATWIITTSYLTTKNLSKSNTDLLITAIRDESGGQFPVLGIVYEDMNGNGQTPYVFKDGVTVFLKNKTDNDLSLINDENIERSGKYARIISTTREQFKAMFPKTDTTGLNWLRVVRNEYKRQ